MDWLVYLVMILVSIAGTIGHSLTLLVLRRIRHDINIALDSTTQCLMTGLALCELLFCATAIPLNIWNAAVGDAWPFNLPGVSYYSPFYFFNLSSVSLYHSTIIAILRFLAVFKPVVYTNFVRNGFMRKITLVVPWIFGWCTRVVLHIANLCQFGFDSNTGQCGIVLVELYEGLSLAAARARLVACRATGSVFGVLVPVVLGCVLYICVLVKLRRRKKQQEQVRLRLTRLHAMQQSTPGLPRTINRAANTSQAKARNAFADVRSIRSRKQLQVAAARPGNDSSAARSYNAVFVIALVCFVNFLLICPSVLMYAFGLYNVIMNTVPVLVNILYLLYYVGFCTTPFVYFTSSTEMRAAYLKIFGNCFKCKMVGKATVAPASNIEVGVVSVHMNCQ